MDKNKIGDNDHYRNSDRVSPRFSEIPHLIRKVSKNIVSEVQHMAENAEDFMDKNLPAIKKTWKVEEDELAFYRVTESMKNDKVCE